MPSNINVIWHLQVWQINESAKTSLPKEDIGKFYSGDCSIILYTYPAMWIYMWMWLWFMKCRTSIYYILILLLLLLLLLLFNIIIIIIILKIYMWMWLWFMKCRNSIYYILLRPRILPFHSPAGMVLFQNMPKYLQFEIE